MKIMNNSPKNPTNNSKSVAIIGGGIAGLSAAFELAERGFQVSVYEAKDIYGGKAFSFRKPWQDETASEPRSAQNIGLPGEHGFRFFLNWYSHLFHTMKRIPIEGDIQAKTIFDRLLPVEEMLYGEGLFGSKTNALDGFHFPLNLAQLLIASEARINAEFRGLTWKSLLQQKLSQDMSEEEINAWIKFVQVLVALKTDLGCAATITKTLSRWIYNPGTRILNGPTNEVFIEPWIEYLEKLGVKFYPNHQLIQIHLTVKEKISHLSVKNQDYILSITADYYILALPLSSMKKLITEDLISHDPQLEKINLLKTEWMSGLQLYVKKPLKLPQGFIGFEHSPWALSLVQQTDYWQDKYKQELASMGINAILSAIISDFNTPGILFNKPAKECSPEEIKAEVWAQMEMFIPKCYRQAFQTPEIVDWVLDPSLQFTDIGIINTNPIFVNTVGSWENRPSVTTKFANLLIIGSYVRCYTDVWTMEGANETARLAVNAILKDSNSSAPKCELFYDFDNPFASPATACITLDNILFNEGKLHPFAYFSESTKNSLEENLQKIVIEILDTLSFEIFWWKYYQLILDILSEFITNEELRQGIGIMLNQYLIETANKSFNQAINFVLESINKK